MNPLNEFPCSVCSKNVEDNHPALLCQYCNLWSHNKCNNIKSKEYKSHQNKNDLPFCCLSCCAQIPFFNLNANEFEVFTKFDVSPTENDSNIGLVATPAQQVIAEKLNNLIAQANLNKECDTESDQHISCNYYSCEDFVNAKFQAKNNFSIFHLNIHSIQLHINDLSNLLHALDFKFDVIAISESKLKHEPQIDISIEGYHAPYCRYTEAEKGGTILYIL